MDVKTKRLIADYEFLGRFIAHVGGRESAGIELDFVDIGMRDMAIKQQTRLRTDLGLNEVTFEAKQ